MYQKQIKPFLCVALGLEGNKRQAAVSSGDTARKLGPVLDYGPPRMDYGTKS
jgi:hypothetical protein